MTRPLFVAEEMEERKALGERVQSVVGARVAMEAVVGPVFWSLLMTAPIRNLRSWAEDECKPEGINSAYMTTKALGHLLNTCRSQRSPPLVAMHFYRLGLTPRYSP